MSTKSSAPSGTPERAALLRNLFELGRSMSTQTVFLHQAIAETVGLNATDTKCIDLVLRAPDATLTAGQLAALSGLSSGAVTHIVDRLEKRGFVERGRDAKDRRKVRVRVRMAALEPVIPKYETIGAAYLALLARYSDAELRLICDYLERISAVSASELARLATARQRALRESFSDQAPRPAKTPEELRQARKGREKPAPKQDRGRDSGRGRER